ncbi:MAG: hypothetical protein K2Z81_19230 [Cyanobacteria bacterium]|nr:hypothetical protein [Cyanobacteriota bacterium]
MINDFSRYSERDRFLALSDPFFDNEYIYREIYEKKSDIDILLIGGCQIDGGLDPIWLQKRLGEEEQEPKVVVCFGQYLECEDLSYFLLKELLKRRKVRLVIWQTPTAGVLYQSPHPSSVIWYGLKDIKMLLGVSPMHKAMIYAQSVLGGPRNLLSLFRPSPTTRFSIQGEEAADAKRMRMGWKEQFSPESRDRFQEFRPLVTEIPAEELFYDTNPTNFVFLNEPLGDYHMMYLKRAMHLIHEKKIGLVMLHFPLIDEKPSTSVPERMFWPDIAKPVRLMGATTSRLFGAMTPEEKKLLFWRFDHLNYNGRALFSKAIFGGILRAYRETNCSE